MDDLRNYLHIVQHGAITAMIEQEVPAHVVMAVAASVEEQNFTVTLTSTETRQRFSFVDARFSASSSVFCSLEQRFDVDFRRIPTGTYTLNWIKVEPEISTFGRMPVMVQRGTRAVNCAN